MSRSLEAQLALAMRIHRRKGILLDTNVLLLLVLSSYSPELVGGPRLEKYGLADVELLVRFVGGFSRVLTTPHVLTEVSNLASQVVRGKARQALFSQLFPLFCEDGTRAFLPLAVASRSIDKEAFVRLGLTDAALASLSSGHLLLTDDLQLYLRTASQGATSINFTHMREAAGLV